MSSLKRDPVQPYPVHQHPNHFNLLFKSAKLWSNRLECCLNECRRTKPGWKYDLAKKRNIYSDRPIFNVLQACISDPSPWTKERLTKLVDSLLQLGFLSCGNWGSDESSIVYSPDAVLLRIQCPDFSLVVFQ